MTRMKISVLPTRIVRMALAMTVCLTSASTMNAQTSVRDYEPGVSKDGVVYFMPKTAIDVHMKVVKVTYTPGDLCKYADRFMRLTDVSDKESLHYELQSVGVTYAPVPDEEKCFHISFSDKSIAPLVQLSTDGNLLAINTENPYAANDADETTANKANAPLDPRAFMTEDMLMASSKAKLAELVAREIYDIRDSKSSLIRGESDYMPADGAGLKIMVDNLQKQEDALLQLFTGTTICEESENIVRIVPEQNINKQIICRFSRKLGCVDADDLAGAPIYIDVKSQATQGVALGEPVDSIAMAKKAAKIKKQYKSYDGVVYNVPAKANIRVYSTTNVFADDKASIAQFGSLETLSSKLFGKKTTTKVILDPTIGSLLKIEQ